MQGVTLDPAIAIAVIVAVFAIIVMFVRNSEKTSEEREKLQAERSDLDTLKAKIVNEGMNEIAVLKATVQSEIATLRRRAEYEVNEKAKICDEKLDEADNILTAARIKAGAIIAEGQAKKDIAFQEYEIILDHAKSQEDAILAAARTKYDELEEKEEAFKMIYAEKTVGFPWLAGKLADFYTANEYAIAEAMEFKRNPAVKSADEVRRLASEKKKLLKQLHEYQSQIEYYESLFPWLADYRDIPDEMIMANERGEVTEKEEDPAFKFFTKSESEHLSKSEIFQRALNRYIARRKSNWEIGRDYERYIGHLYEIKGFDVQFFGATEGLRDMGRDLIAKKKGEPTQIIQCKYWAKDKIIHEKHIFQLFGTAVMHAVSQVGMKPGGALKTMESAKVSPVFICSCCLSDIARTMAQGLGVVVKEEKSFDVDYPRIKCNIGKDSEKIYHLPFDQMYDRIKIEPDKNEFYAKTVAEAEEKGFRRAWRWRG